jgi:NAD(P)-dependent dehydrogenase (short-subunit alcohol dehydrogenase family)
VKDGYTVSKELLIVYAMNRCVSWGNERRIRVNCTAPCPTNTAFMAPTIAAMGEEYFERFPYPSLGRMATPEEQAWPLILVNSPLNATVSGAVVYTDQGFTGGAFTGAIDVSSIMPTGVA